MEVLVQQHLSRASWLAAAASAATSLAVASGTPVRAQSMIPLKIGTGGVEANAQIFYAQEQGYFRKAGLDVDIVVTRGGTTTMAAVIGGDMQAGIANVVSLAVARLKGVPLEIIAPGAYYDTKSAPSTCVVAPDSPIKDAKDLNGKVVGGISMGGLDQLGLWAYIDRHGGDVSTVKFIEVPDATMVEALAQGRIAAASMGEPHLSAAGNKVRLLAKCWDDIAPVFMQTAWFTTEDWLAKNKDVAKRFGDAVIAGGRWGMANPDLAPAVLEKYSKFRMTRGMIRFGEKLDPAVIQPVFDSSYKFKLISGPLKATDMTWNGK
jgi:NitT/TauT family transport system substrate-binding protein